MPFLPQMSRSYVVFGKVRTLPVTTYIFVNFLEQHIKFPVPRQKAIQLPLLSGPVIVRHLRGLDHGGLEKIVLVLIGKVGQPVHLVQYHLFQKFHPDIMGLRAFPQAGIVVLADEKLDVVIALVKVEVEVSPHSGCFRTPENTLGSWVTVGRLRRVPFFKFCTFSQAGRSMMASCRFKNTALFSSKVSMRFFTL